MKAYARSMSEGDLSLIWHSAFKTDNENNMTHMFWMPKVAVEIAKSFGQVLIQSLVDTHSYSDTNTFIFLGLYQRSDILN